MSYPKLYLKPGKERVAASRHPWIFDGALDAGRGSTAAVGVVEVRDANDELVGVGTYNPGSPIAVRLFTAEDRSLDIRFFTERFERALALRRALVPDDTDAYRLINGEGDGVPGLVIDSFAGHLVLQLGTPGLELLRGEWEPALRAVFAPRSVLARPNQAAANRERMRAPSGQLDGVTPPEIEIREDGVCLLVAPHTGQKTGFFCDQRENRQLVARLARGRRVLDCYAYTGAFATHALAAGAAAVTCVESSGPAVELLERNLARVGGGDQRIVHGDALEFLGACDDRFDLVVLDPPALAKRRQHVERASRLYGEIFTAGLRLVSRGGMLLACSCSAALDRGLFDRIVSAASRAAGRRVQVLRRAGAAPDHPVSAFHPEGDYLKTILLRVG